ncbi:MAG: tetratricopeptide repeat protein [Rhodospirillaceae bacterium]
MSRRTLFLKSAAMGALVALSLGPALPTQAAEPHAPGFKAAMLDHSALDHGILNPEELSLTHMIDRLERGEFHPLASLYGYFAAKSGDYVTARRIFSVLAERGDAKSMTWMAWLEDNGFGGPENPDAAADWDRRAMETGDHIGTFNYGLDLLRGRGVPKNPALGREMIDRAAEAGDSSAEALRQADYDLDAVTPDADNWKYNPYFY